MRAKYFYSPPYTNTNVLHWTDGPYVLEMSIVREKPTLENIDEARAIRWVFEPFVLLRERESRGFNSTELKWKTSREIIARIGSDGTTVHIFPSSGIKSEQWQILKVKINRLNEHPTLEQSGELMCELKSVQRSNIVKKIAPSKNINRLLG